MDNTTILNISNGLGISFLLWLQILILLVLAAASSIEKLQIVKSKKTKGVGGIYLAISLVCITHVILLYSRLQSLLAVNIFLIVLSTFNFVRTESSLFPNATIGKKLKLALLSPSFWIVLMIYFVLYPASSTPNGK